MGERWGGVGGRRGVCGCLCVGKGVVMGLCGVEEGYKRGGNKNPKKFFIF